MLYVLILLKPPSTNAKNVIASCDAEALSSYLQQNLLPLTVLKYYD